MAGFYLVPKNFERVDAVSGGIHMETLAIVNNLAFDELAMATLHTRDRFPELNKLFSIFTMNLSCIDKIY